MMPIKYSLFKKDLKYKHYLLTYIYFIIHIIDNKIALVFFKNYMQAFFINENINVGHIITYRHLCLIYIKN